MVADNPGLAATDWLKSVRIFKVDSDNSLYSPFGVEVISGRRRETSKAGIWTGHLVGNGFQRPSVHRETYLPFSGAYLQKIISRTNSPRQNFQVGLFAFMQPKPLARHAVDIVHPPTRLYDHDGMVILRIIRQVLGRRYQYRAVAQPGEKTRQAPDQEKEYQPGQEQKHPQGYRIE